MSADRALPPAWWVLPALAVEVVVALLVVAACQSSPPPPPLNTAWQPSLAAAQYAIRYSPQQPAHPAAASPGWAASIPVNKGPLPCPSSATCPALHYITTPAGGSLVGKSITLTGAIEVTGSPTFGWRTAADNTCTTPASVHLLLQRVGDDKLNTDTYRWWSTTSVVLVAGSFTVTVPLTPDQWSSVFGHRGDTLLAGFNDALNHLGNIGMTFGGGCFYGHGVYIDQGSALFHLTGFVINR